jgi:hypothetical protein
MSSGIEIPPGGKVAKLLSFAFGGWLVFQQPQNMLRLAGTIDPTYFTLWGYIFWPVYLGIVVLCFLAGLEAMRGTKAKGRLKKRDVPTLAPVVFAFFIYVSCIGLAHGWGLVTLKESFQYYLLGPVIYFGCVTHPGADRWLFNKQLMRAVLVVHVLSVIYYSYSLAGRVYPGYGTPSIAIATLYFLKTGAYPLVAIGFTLILLEGKRGVLVALLFGFLWGLRALNRGPFRSGPVKTVMFAVVGAALGISALASLSVLSKVAGPDSETLARLEMVNPFSNSFDLYKGSSGRVGEISSAVDAMSEGGNWLIGVGTGFTYAWDPGYAKATNEHDAEKGYLHASYLNYLMHGGVVVGLIVVLVLTYFCLYKGGTKRFTSGDKRMEIVATICAMSWAQCWFGFNTASDPLLWATLGAGFLALRQKSTQSQIVEVQERGASSFEEREHLPVQR